MVRRAAALSIAIVAVLILSTVAVLAASTASPHGPGALRSVADDRQEAIGSPARAVGSLSTTAAPASHIVPSISAYTTILPDGTLAGATAPISQTGTTYDLTASFAGAVIDERNGSTLNGNGYTLTSSVPLGFAVQVNTTTGVTVTDLKIVDEDHAVEVVNSTSTVVSSTSAGPTTGTAFVALDSTAVTFGSDSANASNIGFGANDSLTVDFVDDYASNDLSGFLAIADTGVEEVDSTATDDGYGFAVGDSESIVMLGGTFSSATVDGVELIQDTFVTIQDVTSTSPATGLLALLGSYVEILGSSFTKATDEGGYIEYVDDLTVDDSDFSDAGGDGLEVNHGSAASFDDDQANATGISGFVIENLSTSTLSSLTANGDGWNGLFLADSNSVTVAASDFNAVVKAGGNGSYIRSSSDVNYTGDAFLDDASGVYDVGSHSLEIAHSNATTGDFGFVFLEDVDSTIVNDIVDDQADLGIEFALSSNFLAESDNLTGDDQGIIAVETLTGAIVQDSVVGATTLGILLDLDSGSSVDLCHVTNTPAAYEAVSVQGSEFFADNATNASEFGILVTGATGVAITAGNYSQSGYGFVVLDSTATNVSGNSFYDDTDDFGMELDGLSETTVYWNNFIDGGGWLFDAANGTATSVVFDAGYPGGGNYWSNWTTPDVEHGPGQNLSGGDGIVDVPFEISGPYEDHYPLTRALNLANLTVVFVAHGLPSGSSWGFQWGSDLFANTSDSTLSVFIGTAAWANYTYSIYSPAGWAAHPARGTIAFTGGLEVVNVDFTPVTYTASFEETGLPTGTNWSVDVAGTHYSGTGSTISVALANGTYNYSVDPIAGYVASPPSGSVTVDADTPTVSVTFTAVLYPVVVSETGLPAGTSWTVTFGGKTATSITPTLTFHIANGSYHYLVGNISGYTVSPYSGVQAVDGPGVSIGVVYTASSSSGSSLFGAGSWLSWVLLVLVVVLAVAVVVLLFRGRRKPEPATGVAGWTPPSPAAAPPAAVGGGTPAAPPPGAVSPPPPDWKET